MIRRVQLLLYALPWLVIFHGFPTSLRAAETLTNAADVLSLTSEAALSGIPVAVSGVVTAAEADWAGRFFVQDATGGVFVENTNAAAPAPGDRVSVTGISHPGGYAPIITKPHWAELGTAPLPSAKPVTFDRLMAGAEDSQRVEITGIVRATETFGHDLGIELVSGGYRLRAFAPLALGIEPHSLVGATVRLRGTAATAFNAKLRHIVSVNLFVPQPSDLTILKPGLANPFAEELTPLTGIAQYKKNRPFGDEVHVKGIVTFQRKGIDLFLQDASGGLQVKSPLTEPLSPGDEVEAVGFPAVENFLPVLGDAQYRKTGGPHTAPVSEMATATDLQRGYYHGDYITLQARVTDRLMKDIDPTGGAPTPRTVLVLQMTNFMFTAEAESAAPNLLLASIPIGSLVRISGICLLDSSDDGRIKSFRLLLPATPDIQILEKPGWFTAQHLLASLLLVLSVLLIAIFWTVLVSKNNVLLKSVVREKEAAQQELQQAHDLLEERVRERTDQLKVEMTARKESELQFRATLTERTRLAQELHDTLEQTLTGIALQMDMTANLYAQDPAEAALHLKLARNLMRQSQLDVRQSVWGLRSRASEQFNLTNAVLVNARQVAGSAGIQVHVEAFGEAPALPEVVEENLMRISQEAITNVVKHSGATRVRTELHFNPQQVVLQIQDNGRGFDPGHCAGPQEGHFGLLGIAERCERMGGSLKITSAPGQGTTIRVEIPVPADEPTPAVPLTTAP